MSNIKKITDDYYELQSKLSELGLYETGMDIDEMQKIDGAINESVLEQDENADFENSDYEFFAHNSTMISFSGNSNSIESGFISHESCLQNISLPSSPKNVCEKIIVTAQVHHELNYSPDSGKNITKKPKSEEHNSQINNIPNTDNQLLMETNILDSGLFLEPTNPTNMVKNLNTFFKNVTILK